ncbi:MAG: aminotransferase class I/II-fold pyridoxal phosphate-dependent enzyme [Spirochaetaceae bacterium]|nr:aminotransferase class I/II-fold pyridoxal phosphate-dependent enzyme [Spirochaetaceae bacterium]
MKLNTNENPYPPPPSVVQAMRDASCEKLRLYPDPSCAALRQAIAERHNVEPSRTFAGNGSDEVLALAFGAFFEDAERAHAQPIVFPDVTYSFYPTFARLWNVPYGTAPLQDDWTIRSDDYLAQCGGAVIANPNAPTGIALDPERLLEIAHFQARNNAVVIVDEAYADFGADSVIPRLNSGAHDNILVVKTLSKSHSLAGLRVGYAVGSPQLIAALERMRDSFNSYTLGAVAQAGAAAALREGAYYERTIRAIVATRSRVSADLIGRGFTVLPSSANFIFIKHPQLSGPQFLQRLRERRILARHFDAPRTANHIRVTIGADSDMDAFLDACQ